jgi:hypothetical protein
MPRHLTSRRDSISPAVSWRSNLRKVLSPVTGSGSVYIRCKHTSGAMAANAEAQRVFGVQEEGAYWPHVGLFYCPRLCTFNESVQAREFDFPNRKYLPKAGLACSTSGPLHSKERGPRGATSCDDSSQLGACAEPCKRCWSCAWPLAALHDMELTLCIPCNMLTC